MATILQFPRGQTPDQREVTSADDGVEARVTADILLFTGVRYERHPELLPSDMPPLTPPPGSKKASRKKRIEA